MRSILRSMSAEARVPPRERLVVQKYVYVRLRNAALPSEKGNKSPHDPVRLGWAGRRGVSGAHGCRFMAPKKVGDTCLLIWQYEAQAPECRLVSNRSVPTSWSGALSAPQRIRARLRVCIPPLLALDPRLAPSVLRLPLRTFEASGLRPSTTPSAAPLPRARTCSVCSPGLLSAGDRRHMGGGSDRCDGRKTADFCAGAAQRQPLCWPDVGRRAEEVCTPAALTPPPTTHTPARRTRCDRA